MELKIKHLSAVIPQMFVTCTDRYASLDETNNHIYCSGEDNNGNDIILAFYADQFPLTEDTACQIIDASITDEDGNIYNIRHSAQPTITINGNEATITYTDCMLPLNGTNGTITCTIVNQR